MTPVDRRTGTELHLRRTAIEAGDTLGPQPRQKIGVVAVAEERLGVCTHELRIEMRHDGDLVLATDRREDRANLRVGEGRVEVGGTLLRARAEPTGCRILNGDEVGNFGQAAHRLVVHRWSDTGSGE